MSERDEYPEGFDEACGIEAQFMRAANAALCDMTGNRQWDVPCLAAHIRAARAPQAVPALTEPVAWMHVMDNTEGIPENKPWVRITQSPENPFGVPGEDYSETFPVTSTPLYAAPQPSPEPKGPEHAHDWRFSLQDHVYKCDCGATRGDYPFGAASFKD